MGDWVYTHLCKSHKTLILLIVGGPGKSVVHYWIAQLYRGRGASQLEENNMMKFRERERERERKREVTISVGWSKSLERSGTNFLVNFYSTKPPLFTNSMPSH